MNEVQRIARMIAQALHADLSPDSIISPAQSDNKGGFYVVPRGPHTIPLWRYYEPAAQAVVDDRERQLEQELTQP